MAPLESPAEGAGAEAAPQQQEVVQPSTIPRARSLRRTATFGERARDVSEQIAEEFANLRDTVAAFPQPEAFMEPEAEAPSEQEQDVATEVDSAIPAGSEHEQVVAAAVAATAGGAAAREEGKDAKKVKAKVVLLLDKVSFVLGVVLIYVSAFWIGWSPSTFYQLYVWLALVLFGCRFVYYYRRGLHYYMLDLCYWANFAAMVGLWFYPSPLLHKIVFAYNSGPLAWSIFAMRNSLVLHRFENLITLFMHWYPAMVSWTLRWHPSCAQRGTCDLAAEQQLTGPQWASASFVELGLLPMGFYAVWMVLYYLKLFVLSADKIKKRNYDTVYHWMIRNQKHPLTLLINRFPPWAQPLVYLAIHGCCCWLTFMSTYILWHSYWAHTAVICMLSIDAAWNGANFYFEVFAHRYIRALGLQLKPLKKKD